MSQNLNRLDHICWVSHPHTIEDNCRRIEELTGVKLRGPHVRPDMQIRAYLSWESGLEIVAPEPGADTPMANMMNDILASQGEGIMAVVHGVPDIQAAIARATKLGYQPSGLLTGLGGEPWEEQTTKMNESMITSFMGSLFMYGEIEYSDGVFVTKRSPDQKSNQNVRHLDHIIYASHPDNLEANAERLSGLVGIRLEGPFERDDLGVRVYASAETGVEIVAPMAGSDAPYARRVDSALQARGEHMFSLVFGTTKLEDAVVAARRVGLEPCEIVRASPGEPWHSKTDSFAYNIAGDFMNTLLVFGEIEYPESIFVTEKSALRY